MRDPRVVDTTNTFGTAEFQQQAHVEDDAIRKDFKILRRSWASLARRCEEFAKKKYYRAIPDAKGKPFKTFADWARATFGKSASTMFAYRAIMRQLGGTIKEGDLDNMTRQNAETLAKATKLGQDPKEFVAQATTQTHREFVRTVGLDEDCRHSAEDFVNVGPFRVSRDTKPVFEEACCQARLATLNVKGVSPDDQALKLIASTYLSSIHAVEKKGPESIAYSEQMEPALVS